MAGYQTSVRSNYFRVKDENLFMAFMSRVEVDGDDIEISLGTDANGMPQYSFATNGLIIGIPDDDDETSICADQFEAFIVGLQELVDDNDAVIIMEVGNSKLGDIFASATIITSYDTDYVDLQEIASDRAIDLLCGLRTGCGNWK